MKKNSLLKLLTIAIAVAMLLSMFVACDNTEDPTETPTDAPTEAPTKVEETDPVEEETTAEETTAEETTAEETTAEETTAEETTAEETTAEETTAEETTAEETTAEETTAEETTAEETTAEETTAEETTAEETTAEETTAEETTAEETTEEETEYAPAVENEIKDDYTYLISVTQENADKILYLTGEMDGYYFATTEDYNAALVVRAAVTEGGFYLFYYNGNDKVYINIVSETKTQDDGSEKTFNNVVYSAEAVSVWTYDATLKTPVTKVGDKTFFLGTYGDYTTISATDAEKYPDNFKATLRVPEPGMCTHPYAMSEEGHWKIACARCEKAIGSVKDHYYIEHTVNGDVIVEACTVCGYVVPMPDSIQMILYDSSIQGTKVPNYMFAQSVGEDEDGTKYRRYDATQASQSIWAGKGSGWNHDGFSAGNSKYLVMKVRGNGDLTQNFRFYLGASADSAGTLAIRFDINNMVAADQWTWIVIDLEKSLVREDGTDIWVANADGEYFVDRMYFHAQPSGGTSSFDFATMAFVSDWSGVAWVMDGATEYQYVTGGKNTVTEADAATILDAPYLEANAANKGYQMAHTLLEEDGNNFIHWDPNDTVGQWILTRQFASVPADRKPVVVDNDTKYFVIRARQNNIPENVAEKAGFSFTLGNYTQTSGRFSMDFDELIGSEWTTIVIDLNAVDPNLLKLVEEEGDYKGKLVFDYVQVTLNATTATYDIDFLGFAESLAALEGVSGSKATLIGAEKAVSTISLATGEAWVEPAVVLDTDFFTKHNPRVDWALSVSDVEGASRFTSTAGTAAEQAIIQVGRPDQGWTNASINVATAKFLVFKVKGSRDGLKGYMLLGTGDGVAAAAGHKTLYVDYTTEYTTYVVNLEELHGDWNATDGNYIIDKLSYVINFEAADKDTNYVDVAYTAFATTWAQVAEIVDVDTVKYATTIGTSSADSILASAKDQDITVDPTSAAVPKSVKVNVGSYGTLWQGTLADQKEGDVSFQRFTTTAANSTCQLIWRDPWRNGAATSSPSPIDVKTCGMFVMTYKTSTFAEGASMTVRFSTVETPLAYREDGSILGDNAQRIVFTTAAVSEWTTVVVDLKTVNPTFIVSADGTYKVDDFTLETFGLAMGEYVDIAYMGFVENWAGVDYVVDVENVVEITNIDGTNATVAIADKVAAEQTPET